MRYSVWDAGARRYNYFETSAPAPHAAKIPSLSGTDVGVASTAAAPLLPAGAVPAGNGKTAMGTIARRGGAGGALGDLPPAAGMVGFGVAAWLLWKMWRK